MRTLLVLCALSLGGCGGVSYAIAVNSAASRVEEAKAVGAEQLAPYEYYYAREHLQQAQIYASQASYGDAANLADEAERNTLMERARAVIVQLPREQRKTLEMAFFDGLTHSEIAEMTGDPLGTVKTRIRSALLTLRKAFQS